MSFFRGGDGVGDGDGDGTSEFSPSKERTVEEAGVEGAGESKGRSSVLGLSPFAPGFPDSDCGAALGGF